ncbi:MAG: glycosyltransferase [Candidatus Omnitrophica bacterium]|nr:glycosyltransferase [Candidatus Omnitrophota bacterium]
MKKTYPKVSIITVNFNGRKYLRSFFLSLSNLNYTKSKIEVIFVDNASTDGSVEYVRKRFPKVKIIKNKVNNYCKALNLGFGASRAPYCALLNNDVKTDKNWLVELVKVMLKEKNIAVAGSKILTADGKIQNAAHYERPNFYWGERGAGEEKIKFDKLEEVPSLCGAAVLYKKEAVIQAGLFDEDFVIYGEDVDMSFRLREKGYKLYFVPTSIVYHKFHGTASEELARFYIERNRLLYLAKHYPHKLSSSLVGSGYFTAAKSGDSAGKIYSLFPDIILKLIKTHPWNEAKVIASELFEEIKKIVNYENDILIKELNKLTQDRDKTKEIKEHILKDLEQKTIGIKRKDDDLFKKTRDLVFLNDKLKLQDNLISQLNLEIQKHLEKLKSDDTQISGFTNQITEFNLRIQEQLDTLRRKDQLLSERENELANLNNDLSNLSQKLRQKAQDMLLKDNQLVDKDTKISSLNIQINDFSQQLQLHISALKDKDRLLSERDQDITNLKNEFNNLSQQLRDRLSELATTFHRACY